MTTYYIITGEPSGDVLGADLIRALKKINPQAKFRGIGGAQMQQEGFDSLFDQSELALMGVFEVLRHLWRLNQRLQETICDIKKVSPDCLITIDSPGFNKRLLKKIPFFPLQRRFHYVAPSVWAWRPKRAEHFARLTGHMLCLFPCEPAYFKQAGLDATFIGHPLAHTIPPQEMNRTPPSYPPQYLCLPGSRIAEIQTLLPLFLSVMKRIQHTHLHGEWTLITLDHHVSIIQKIIGDFPLTLVTQEQAKKLAFKTAQKALAASGTVSLELGLYGTPHVIAYRINPLTAFIVRLLKKTPYVSLVNILLNRFVIPECIQETCTENHLLHAFLDLSKDRSVFSTLTSLISCPISGEDPSSYAARIITQKQNSSF